MTLPNGRRLFKQTLERTIRIFQAGAHGDDFGLVHLREVRVRQKDAAGRLQGNDFTSRTGAPSTLPLLSSPKRGPRWESVFAPCSATQQLTKTTTTTHRHSSGDITYPKKKEEEHQRVSPKKTSTARNNSLSVPRVSSRLPRLRPCTPEKGCL